MQQGVSMSGECYENRDRQNEDISAGEEVLVRSQAAVSRTVAGETLIVPVRGKVGDLASIYSFNETGTLIWRLLETPTTLTAIVAAMAREFEVTQERAESDAVRFVREMLSVGLVEVRSVGTERPVGRGGLAAASAR
jgi:Coenzyme PQQ synthesis protein D (PqqD)